MSDQSPPSGTNVVVNLRTLYMRATTDFTAPPPPETPEAGSNVEFRGWLQDPHPVSRKGPDGKNSKGVRLSPWCWRIFLFKDAYRTSTTWVLPEVTQALRMSAECDPVVSTERPYSTTEWGPVVGHWGGFGAARFGMDGTDLLDSADHLTGYNIFRLAAGPPNVLPLVPPNALHDLMVIVQQWVLGDRLLDMKLVAANQSAEVHVCFPP